MAQAVAHPLHLSKLPCMHGDAGRSIFFRFPEFPEFRSLLFSVRLQTLDARSTIFRSLPISSAVSGVSLWRRAPAFERGVDGPANRPASACPRGAGSFGFSQSAAARDPAMRPVAAALPLRSRRRDAVPVHETFVPALSVDPAQTLRRWLSSPWLPAIPSSLVASASCSRLKPSNTSGRRSPA